MIVYLSRGIYDPEISVPFPTTPDSVWCAITELDEHCASTDPVKIVGVLNPIAGLERHISCANLEEETDILKLNMLAGLIDSMTAKERDDLSPALAMGRPNSMDSILEIVGKIAPHEIIDGIKTDKALGTWLVDHDLEYAKFPTAVRPYLDYSMLGAKYRSEHGGLFVPQGYMKRLEVVQRYRPSLVLTLVSTYGSDRISLPATASDLDRVKESLHTDHLEDAAVKEITAEYSWAHLLPLDSITLDSANILAQCIQEMSEAELKTFGATLEATAPTLFSDAVCIAENIEDY